MNPVIEQSSSVEEIRARNGFKVVVAGFTTVLVAFIAAMFFWSNHLEPSKAIASSDIVALLGDLTGVVGALVGSYFGDHRLMVGYQQRVVPGESGRLECHHRL